MHTTNSNQSLNIYTNEKSSIVCFPSAFVLKIMAHIIPETSVRNVPATPAIKVHSSADSVIDRRKHVNARTSPSHFL